ncbi:MAG: sugar ABC transporter ATP-binding protein [Clostridiaceae bacterium]|nr:sugar ABC transporter ATP-binding protein [Clostridiaceae bacterium]
MENKEILLTMRKISKTFPGVKALNNVDFTLRKGEIHALLGENGAGKSTLIKVLTGVESMDGGQVTLEGKPIHVKSSQHAQTLGISTVYQEINLCGNLSVAENIFIGREPMAYGMIDWKMINKRAKELLNNLNVDIDVTKTLDSYPVAIQQMVAIARALDISAKVLILDEPTSSLDAAECKELFTVMRKLCNEGMGIIFVTHFLDQVYEVSDRITVLRNGELVGEYEAKSLPKVELIGKMIGKDYEQLQQIESAKKAHMENKESYLTCKNLTTEGNLKNLDLEVNKGEVLGLAGLLGSGRTETVRALFGADKILGGELSVKNTRIRNNKPITAIRKGMGYCSEDRKSEGIVGELTIRENIILALQAKKGMFRFIGKKEQTKISQQYIKLLDIKTPGCEQQIKNLSGGNQQKVLLARWLATNPELLMLDEPTRGIDVGTKAEIQKIVLELAEKGMSIIFISSEMDEMLRCCERMVVLNDKKKLGELSGNEKNEQVIMEMIAGGKSV